MVVLHVMHKINSQYIHKYIHKCIQNVVTKSLGMVVLQVMHKINSQYIHECIHKCNHKECRYGGAAGYAGNCGVHCDTDAGGLAEKHQIGI